MFCLAKQHLISNLNLLDFFDLTLFNDAVDDDDDDVVYNH